VTYMICMSSEPTKKFHESASKLMLMLEIEFKTKQKVLRCLSANHY